MDTTRFSSHQPPPQRPTTRLQAVPALINRHCKLSLIGFPALTMETGCRSPQVYPSSLSPRQAIPPSCYSNSSCCRGDQTLVSEVTEHLSQGFPLWAGLFPPNCHHGDCQRHPHDNRPSSSAPRNFFPWGGTAPHRASCLPLHQMGPVPSSLPRPRWTSGAAGHPPFAR